VVVEGRNRLVLAGAAALALADASIVTLALPRLLTELDATVEGVAAVIGVYTVVVAIALAPAERLRRSLGAPRLGALSLGVFAAACAGCAAAPSLELLLLLRALQAVGGAGVLVAAFDVLGAGSPGSPGRRVWSLAAVVGVAAGPALGGLLTQAFDWRAIFVAQVPLALAGAVACAQAPRAAAPAPPRRGEEEGRGAALAALGLVSASLVAVLFLLVLLLVAGWALSPLAAAATVSVLPLAALLAARSRGSDDPRARAATGCALVGAGTLALGFLPGASAWWTIVPQLLAGAGMGLALPALAGELLPERTPNEAGRLLAARHAAIALALLVLAPIVSSQLDSATERARERGVALVLDSPLPPEDKLVLAPQLLGGVGTDEPRQTLEEAVASSRDSFSGPELAEYDSLAQRADDTLVQAVEDSFRAAFLIAGALALVAALLVLPAPDRRPALWRAAAAALAVALVYVVLDAAVGPEPVELADPCGERDLPESGGLGGVLQDEALRRLDELACHFGSSREELVLAIADADDARRYEERHGVNPRSAGDLLQGLAAP
jgi:MFS family permease